MSEARPNAPQAPEGQYISIDPGAISRAAQRQREDAETISQLCFGLESLAKENKSLAARLAEAEAERDGLRSRLAKYEGQPITEGKDGKK